MIIAAKVIESSRPLKEIGVIYSEIALFAVTMKLYHGKRRIKNENNV